MTPDITFFINSILLGVGLAMDAFSVSLANGLHEPRMRLFKMGAVAGVFALFQTAMPLIGWGCVCTVTGCFKAFEAYIPWIALILLGYIGGTMLYHGIKNDEEEPPALTLGALILQGIATSIDALSVGFTIADHEWLLALLSCVIIGIVTFVICFAGLQIGKTVGTKLAGKASILGGCILLFIGIEIWLKSVLA